MPLKFNIKIPSSSSAAIHAKLRPAVEKALADAKPKLVVLIVDRVTMEADTKLHSQAAAYKKAIQDPHAITVDEHGIKVHIKDPTVLALDGGVNSFDIKAKMLPYAKHFSKKGAPYIDVPFTHQPYGRFFGGKDGVPKNVLKSLYKKANKIESDDIRVRTNVHGAAPKSFERELTFGDKKVTTQVHHKTSIHANMIMSRTRGVSSGSFKTIRRISAASDAMSWWHPGFQGLGIFRKVFDQLKRDINHVIGDSFRRVGLKARFK